MQNTTEFLLSCRLPRYSFSTCQLHELLMWDVIFPSRFKMFVSERESYRFMIENWARKKNLSAKKKSFAIWKKETHLKLKWSDVHLRFFVGKLSTSETPKKHHRKIPISMVENMPRIHKHSDRPPGSQLGKYELSGLDSPDRQSYDFFGGLVATRCATGFPKKKTCKLSLFFVFLNLRVLGGSSHDL